MGRTGNFRFLSFPAGPLLGRQKRGTPESSLRNRSGVQPKSRAKSPHPRQRVDRDRLGRTSHITPEQDTLKTCRPMPVCVSRASLQPSSVIHTFTQSQIQTHPQLWFQKKPIRIPEAYLLSRGPRSPSAVPGLPTDEPPYVRVRLESQGNRADDAISTERYFIAIHTHTGRKLKGAPSLGNFSANFIYLWGIGAEVFYNVVITQGG